MELQGQSKTDFEKWYCEVYNPNDKLVKEHYYFYVNDNFDNKKPSEKYGVIVDFADSVGYNISVLPYWEGRYVRGFEPTIFKDGQEPITIFYNSDVFTTRKEARAAAITKFSELYNSKV